MTVKLLKQNKKTTDVVILENENHLIRKKEGKLGKPISFSSSINCGSEDNAVIEIQKLINEYQSKGFVLSEELSNLIDFEIFDKAKWHLEGNFPKDLSNYQAYIHTGFYIGWLIRNNLISNEFKSESKEQIQKFLQQKISPVKLFEEQLDGVFTSNDLNDIGFRFTVNYFDLEKGQYLTDYEEILASNLSTLYNVQDTWENFEKICRVIDKRYQDFSTGKFG